MAVSVIVEMRAKPGQGDALRDALDVVMPDTVHAEGAISFEALRDRDDPDKFTVIGRWRERTEHETYMQWRADTGTGHVELEPVLDTVVITYCDSVATW
jgi:quinol monooxygenase YgiN